MLGAASALIQGATVVPAGGRIPPMGQAPSLSNLSPPLVTGRKGFVSRSLNGSQVEVEVFTSSEE